jgi:hypothetical protein
MLQGTSFNNAVVVKHVPAGTLGIGAVARPAATSTLDRARGRFTGSPAYKTGRIALRFGSSTLERRHFRMSTAVWSDIDFVPTISQRSARSVVFVKCIMTVR